MKTQISRWSHDPKKRRSGIYQQQGRMITDADLNELVELFKQRVDDALGDLVGSGLPRTGTSPVGLVADGPQLRRGSLYVDGIRAQLESSSGITPFALHQQADFPGAPAWAGGSPKVLYADVWEWPYTALQDAGLLDPGLHGADTCTRTQTLAQVKLCAAQADVLDETKNPKKGDATLTLDIRQASSAADPCDPCATEVALDGRVGNYLFRLEVHDVQGPANAPTEITLKWSSENGAEAHAQEDVPAEFKRGDWIYEFYNDTTERHLGVHLGGFTAQRGVFKIGWPVVASDVPAKAQYPYVRRWDGYAVLVRSGGGTWSVKVISSALQAKDKDRVFELLPVGGTPTHGHYTIDTKLVAYLSGLQLTLDLEGRKFVAGDYWLATVREDAESANRVQQAGEYNETGTPPNVVRHYLPLGVTHHYMVLAQANAAGTVQATADAETRRLSFPPLTNLTADRIGYNTGPIGGAVEQRWQDILAEPSPLQSLPLNVQQAIDALVSKLESSDIGYNLPGCTGNTLLALLWSGAPTAQKINDLLDKLLCQIDSSNVPYTVGSAPGTTVKSMIDTINVELPKKVAKAGDTMSGALIINPVPAVPLSLDVKGTLQTEQFKLIAPSGTPNKAVLTYDSATGLAKWFETSLTAWNLSGGNLSTDPASVTGSVTIGAPGGGVYIPHAPTGTNSARSLEIGSQAAVTSGVPNGRIGFPGYGVRHGQVRWIPAAAGAARFEFIDSSNASPSGDYGATPAFVSIKALNGTFSGNLDVSGTLNGRVVGDAATLNGQSNSAFASASHNHDSRYPWSEYTNSNYYNPSQERMLTTFANRPSIVTFVYNLIDASTGLPLPDSYVNGPYSNNIVVRIRKISGSGGGFDKDFELWVRNNSPIQLYIAVEVFA